MELSVENDGWIEALYEAHVDEFGSAIGRLSNVVDVLIGSAPNTFAFQVTGRSNDAAIRSLRRYLVHDVQVNHDGHEYSGFELLTEEAAHLAWNIVPQKRRDECLEDVVDYLLDRAIEWKNETFCLRQAAAAKA